jgi:two-component system chemotaxis response regulator CheB
MKTRVLIVDDSALVRELLRQLLSSEPSIEVVGAAPDPLRARAMIDALRPDVITLDVEMPRMDGLTFLEQLMREKPTPVLMVSSLTDRGAEVTLRALELGAFDFVSKPKIDVQRGLVELQRELVTKVLAAAKTRPRAAASATVRRAPTATSPAIASDASLRAHPLARRTHVAIAIGASTGGTEALREVLEPLPADTPGVVVVQHMPENFTRAFAERLDRACAMRVREARDGDRVLPGHVLIAPGSRAHLEVLASGAQLVVRLTDAPPVSHHRPSVDVMFRSVAGALGKNAVGVLLTGMGADGARGLLAMRRAGAHTLAQDEATSVVYGMPREAVALGAVDQQLPLHEIAEAIVRRAQRMAA